MLRVKELIEMLSKLDQEAVVILSSDEEGNTHTPFASLEVCTYVPETTYSGDVYLDELTVEDIEDGYTEEDMYDGTDGVRAVALYGLA